MGDLHKLKFGLVGGGEGAFIGAVHRLAAELDGAAELVAGCCGSSPARARAAGQRLYGLPAGRSYGSVMDMFAGEAARSPDDRMQFVIVATPNHTHVSIAEAALQHGFAVACDKPLSTDLQSAQRLARQVRASGLPFVVTYNYTGYPLVREARALISSGRLGTLRRIQCEYLQGWLATPVESENKQANWRTDPLRAGGSGCFGDIGSHAENLVHFVTGLQIDSLCADLSTFVPGRRLDDDGNVLLRFKGGARGVICASQVAAGEENALSIRVYGELGGLEWHQQEPNSLILRLTGQPMQVLRAGSSALAPYTSQSTRLPGGHPEGFLEAFANVYRGFFADLRGDRGALYPRVEDGLRGMLFLDRVVASARYGGQWLDLNADGEDNA